LLPFVINNPLNGLLIIFTVEVIKTQMKYFYSLFLLLAFTVACEQKTISGKELEDYYADNIKNHYICTFDVSVRTGNRDTIGVMKAIISRDFSKVNRTQ
jgi:hypothetical protein